MDSNLDNSEANWVNRPHPSLWQSIKALRQRGLGLLDGAYLGLNGEPVIFLSKDKQGSLKNQIPISPPRREILAIDPGLSRVSRFFQQVSTDKSLLVYQGEEMREVEHAEAVNDGLLAEKSYTDIFRYIGEKHAQRGFSVLSETFKKLDNIFGRENEGSMPETAYQVTKKGDGKLFLGQRIIHRPPIIFGGMRFKI